jgi:FkbM family methyltransferase
MDIPIIIICYNNYKYVQNTLDQVRKINIEYYKNIKIVNNSSTCIDTINFLKSVDVKVINTDNRGPWITSTQNKHIYDTLPDKYIVTDPDLELNEKIPSNFVEILSNLSDKYGVFKIGLALDISDFEKMYKTGYYGNENIYDWERKFWYHKINDSNYELYNAPIDTTFCLLNKNNKNDDGIRVAGNFTAKHLPWYINNKVYNVYENYMANIKTITGISTIARLILPYFEKKYLKIHKNDELFLIENTQDNPNLPFWINNYKNWENDSFKIYDKYLSKNNILIEIGGWIGGTSMYGCRKSKHVYSIEADFLSFDDLNNNLQINCTNNYTLIKKAVYNIDDIKLKFGKNKFLENSKMNDSTSNLYNDGDKPEEYYLVDTITLESLIQNYQINPSEIGLIKVDIEGGEENILNDLYDIHQKYKIPIYVSFHFNWWNDKNLDRFEWLSDTIKNQIQAEPFASILVFE